MNERKGRARHLDLAANLPNESFSELSLARSEITGQSEDITASGFLGALCAGGARLLCAIGNEHTRRATHRR